MDKPITLAQIAESFLDATNKHEFAHNHPYRRIDAQDNQALVKDDGSVEFSLYEQFDVFGSGKEPTPGTVYERVYKVKITLEVEELKIEDD